MTGKPHTSEEPAQVASSLQAPVRPYRVSWFSAGVSSAVATKLIIGEIDEIIYTHIDDQNGDTLRFVQECETWFGKPVTILQHDKFKTVEDVLRHERYVNGEYGAPCTKILKKRVRQKWQREHAHLAPFCYAWGIDIEEAARRVPQTLAAEPEHKHRFPLVERRMTKAEAHEILKASGIKRPLMYEKGYHNNNCVGCVKGGMGYWNRIRVDFPEVFTARAKMERDIGASCINGVFLDELEPDRGRHEPPICDECGLLCGSMAIPRGANAPDQRAANSGTLNPVVGKGEIQ